MAFGRRNRADSEPTPVVDWRGIREFELTTALHSKARPQRPKDHGQLAVRVPVPTGRDGERVPMVPCAFFNPSLSLAWAGAAYTDEAATQVLLQTEKQRDEATGEEHHRVLDAAGSFLGLIRRLPPPGRFRKHGWRLEQPGHPEIAASRERVRRPLVVDSGLVVEGIANLLGLAEDGSTVEQARTLAWHAGDERVMTSRAQGPVVIEADWLDRRLAIAYAMLLDR